MMKLGIYRGRALAERRGLATVCLSGAVLAGAAGGATAAQILADAQLTAVPLSGGNYAYTLTLQNTAASTSNIGLFWFGWEAGQADFLTSEPMSITTPSGWSASVQGGGAGDGYSVQFVTYTQPLKPGSSETFTFISGDPPSIMGGPAVLYPEYPALTSQVYSTSFASGLQEVFVVKLAPTDLGRLSAQMSGANLVLNWPAGTNVVLQQTSGLNSANWTTVPGTLGLGTFTVANAAGNASVFYRLATQ